MLPSDKADRTNVADNDTDALARLNAVLGGKIMRVTRSLEFLTVIPRRPLDGGQCAVVRSIYPNAQVTEG
jgi:hypothetical protein